MIEVVAREEKFCVLPFSKMTQHSNLFVLEGHWFVNSKWFSNTRKPMYKKKSFRWPKTQYGEFFFQKKSRIEKLLPIMEFGDGGENL
jgi:hypothetical protein